MRKATLGMLVIVALWGATSWQTINQPQTPQAPVIVASFNMRGITQSIPTTTLFTPADTGIFRVSFYSAMTTTGNSEAYWSLHLNWTDDAGLESTQLTYLSSGVIPPFAYNLNPQYPAVKPISPWVFEAVAGQPITFSMPTNGDPQPGTCGLAITIERLQ